MLSNLKKLKEKRDRGSEKGFTLVELAIVLVIAGIILVGVMKGTDAVNKAKVERMVSDIKGLSGILQEYEKRTGRMAGDCDNNGILAFNGLPLARTALPEMTISTGAAAVYDAVEANRIIDGVAVVTVGANGVCVTSATSEADINMPWNELRRAGVVDASRLPRELARHVMGDVFAIGTMVDAATAGSNSAGVIVIYGVPVWMAESIDAAMDGSATMYGAKTVTGDSGAANTGRVRLWAGAANPVTAGAANKPDIFTAAANANSYDEGANDRDRLVAISYQYTVSKLIK